MGVATVNPILARHDGVCRKCGGKIAKYMDRIVPATGTTMRSKSRWIHEACGNASPAVVEDRPTEDQSPAVEKTTEKVVEIVVHRIDETDEATAAYVGRVIGDAVAKAEESLGAKVGREMNELLNAAVAALKRAIDDKPPSTIIVKRPDGDDLVLKDEIVCREMDQMTFWSGLGKDLFLVGPSGCGKTHAVRQMAKILGVEYGMISCTSGMSEGQITGRLLPTGQAGQFEFVTTQFIERYENGGVFLFDEVDAADPNVMLVVNSALANGELWLPNRHDKPMAKRHKDFVCVFGANTFGRGADRVYVGRNQLDAATLDRFRTVEMDYNEAIERALCPDEILYGTLMIWRRRIIENRMRRLLTTRFVRDMYEAQQAGASMDEIRRQLTAGWSDDEIAKVVH